MKIPWLSTIDCLVYWINLFSNIQPSSVRHIIPQLKDLHQGYVNEMQPKRFRTVLVKVTLSSRIDHCMSSTIASLMQGKMNSASSQIEVLNQFHMNVSCMVTLSCLKYSMKFKRHCFGVNLHGWPKSFPTSLVDLAWLMIFGTTTVINSWNLVKVVCNCSQ